MNPPSPPLGGEDIRSLKSVYQKLYQNLCENFWSALIKPR